MNFYTRIYSQSSLLACVSFYRLAELAIPLPLIHLIYLNLIQVKKVIDLTIGNSTSERELALVKVTSKNNKINLLKKTAKKYKAKLIFNNSKKYAFEITNSPDMINSFIVELNKIGTIDVSRTGLIAILKN